MPGSLAKRGRSLLAIALAAGLWSPLVRAREVAALFDIPEAPLTLALVTFGEQAAVSVLVSEELVRDRSTRGLKGYRDLESGLEELLSGSGLTYRWAGENTIAVIEATPVVHPTLPSRSPSPNVPASTKRSVGVEKMLITAERGDADGIPIALSTFDAEMLRQRNVASIMDVGDHIPNVKFDTSTDPTSARIQIRGLGPEPGVGPRVGLYVDGVYWGYSRGSIFSLMDVERIEVLRGPQGVTFGRNTTGGAVLVSTNQPSADTSASVTLGYGDRNLFTADAVLNYPIREDLFTHLAVQSRRSDGYMKNDLNGDTHWDENNQSLRAAVRHLPTENLDIALTLNRRRQRENGPLFTCRWNGDADPRFETSAFRELMRNDGMLEAYRTSCDRSAQLAPRRGESAVDARWDVDTWGTDAKIAWDLGGFTLRSLSAWRRVEWTGGGDADGTGLVLADSIPGSYYRDKVDALTQELSLSGTSFQGRLAWVAGAHWLDERRSWVVPEHQTFAFSPLADPDPQWEHDSRSLSFFGEATLHLTERLALTAGVRRINERKELSEPAFRYPDSFRWTPYSRVRRDGTIEYRGRVDSFPAIDWSPQRFGVWTPRVAASFQLSDPLMIYGSWSRGFATGDARSPRACGRGLHSQRAIGTALKDPSYLEAHAAELCSNDPEFSEERVSAWETGIKSRWFDDRLRVDVAYFHTRFDDIIIGTSGALHGMLSPTTFNAGSATIQGVEVEASLSPIAGLTLDFGLGTTDARYNELMIFNSDARVLQPDIYYTDERRLDTKISIYCDPCNPEQWLALHKLYDEQVGDPVREKSSLEFENTPGLEFNLGAQYELGIERLGDLTIRADWNHLGGVVYGRNDLSVYEQGKRGVLSARFTLRLLDERTEVALWGRNLLDREYLLAGAPDFDGAFGSELVQYAAPRHFGIEFTRRFGD